MPCNPEELRHVPLFELLDDDETQILASQVDIMHFPPQHIIYKAGDSGGRGYVMMSGKVNITTIDEDEQQVIVDEPEHGDFFGFASLLQQSTHRTTATALDETVCLEVDRGDLEELIKRRPMAGLDMLTVQARQYRAVQKLVESRINRNPNDIIEEQTTFGQRIADHVAQFGGSWRFIITFGITLIAYTAMNTALKHNAWDPYPFILLNLFLSMLAAIQAPVIMMSQNRQDAKDRVRSELDFEVNKRSEVEIGNLSRKLRLVTEKLEDMEGLLRKAAPIDRLSS